MATILIADDVQTNRDLLAKVVVAAGHQTVFAADGEEAVAKATALRPGLVLMDVVMPKMDGFQACRKIKRDPATAGIPVVLVTQKVSDSDRFWGGKQGADDHLGKPFTPEQIRAVLAKFVK